MSLIRLGLAAFLIAVPATADPLGVGDLAALARAGLDDAAIVRLVESDGLEAALGAQDALALREAGMSASLVSRLITWSAGTGIDVEEQDGVLVVSGAGVPGAEEAGPADDAPDQGAEPWLIGPEPQAEPAFGAVNEYPPGSIGHPVGAVFGWSGGATFIPAHYGGSKPSAFGRTVVTFPGGCAPWMGQPILPVALAEPSTGWVTIRTSRGDLRVPN